jgi:alpha,alpha-trehalase
MRHFHLAGVETKLRAHNWSGSITIRSALDGRILNAIGGYTSSENDRKHLETLETSITDDVIYLKTRTVQSHISIAQAARTTLFINEQSDNTDRDNLIENNYVAQNIRTSLTDGNEITIQKITSLFTSRDEAISEEGLAAKEAIADAPKFDVLVDQQIEEWRHLWELFDLSLETNENTPKAASSLLLHLNSFQALSTISKNSINLDVGIPARGWSEGYHGHIFWDDINVYPFLNLHAPLVAKALLKYRYKRLDAARKIAKGMGLPGARFPWQSGSSGREETPLGTWNNDKQEWNPDNSHLQVHVNAAIAFNVWKHYQCTGDLEFMHIYGAEMMFEIARFFAHFAKYNPERSRYEIHGVVGPDEFHDRYPDNDKPGIHNNAYTNLMAVWTLARSLELLKILPENQCNEICQRLKITESEIDLWDDVSRKMFIPFQQNGLIDQFEGYENLQKYPYDENGFIDSDKLKQLLVAVNGLPFAYQVSKQADVLMLFYLFSAEELKELFDRLHYNFRCEEIPKNIEYYIKQTSNHSSLGRVAEAWVISRMDRLNAWKHLHSISSESAPNQANESGIFPSSWNIFEEALVTDFDDIQGGTTADGLHTGAMVGTIDIVQRCYTGLITKDDVLWLNPRLPKQLTRLSFRLQYRQQVVYLEITQKTLKVSAGNSSAQSIKIGFKNKIYRFIAGESKLFDLS